MRLLVGGSLIQYLWLIPRCALKFGQASKGMLSYVYYPRRLALICMHLR